MGTAVVAREIFEGSGNTLTIMKQTHTHELQCSFKLEKYSLDRQTCSIEMASTDIGAYYEIASQEALYGAKCGYDSVPYR